MSELPKRDHVPESPLQQKEGVKKEDPQQKTFNSQTETVTLPSKGLVYREDSKLSSGKVNMLYMTAKHEDILTNQSLIAQGKVIDELIKSLIVDDINYEELLEGDIEALMIAARVFGYGPTYQFKITTPSGKEQIEEVNLASFKDKELDESLVTKGVNLFEYTLPNSGDVVKFKLLTKKDNDYLDSIFESYKKVGNTAGAVTTSFKMMIQEVNGNKDKEYIANYVDSLRALDSMALRKYIAKVQPGVDTSMEVIDRETGVPFRTELRFQPQFFWPDFEG